MITFKHSLIISSWLISAGSAACLRATSPSWPWTAWGRSRCWVSWCLSGWWYDAWSPACESCWQLPLTPCWCTGSWSGRETWETVVGVISASQKSNWGFFFKLSDLKILPRHKREVLQLPLLFAPLFTDAAVSDNHLLAALVEARVEVEGDVTSCGQVHRDPDESQRPQWITDSIRASPPSGSDYLDQSFLFLANVNAALSEASLILLHWNKQTNANKWKCSWCLTSLILVKVNETPAVLTSLVVF